MKNTKVMARGEPTSGDERMMVGGATPRTQVMKQTLLQTFVLRVSEQQTIRTVETSVDLCFYASCIRARLSVSAVAHAAAEQSSK